MPWKGAAIYALQLALQFSCWHDRAATLKAFATQARFRKVHVAVPLQRSVKCCNGEHSLSFNRKSGVQIVWRGYFVNRSLAVVMRPVTTHMVAAENRRSGRAQPNRPGPPPGAEPSQVGSQRSETRRIDTGRIEHGASHALPGRTPSHRRHRLWCPPYRLGSSPTAQAKRDRLRNHRRGLDGGAVQRRRRAQRCASSRRSKRRGAS